MLKQVVRSILPEFGYHRPAQHEIAFELDTTKYTPDVHVIEQYEWQLLFVVDELKEDHIKNHLLGNEAQYKFPAYTRNSFQFFTPPHPFGSPIPLIAGPSSIVHGWPPAAKIKGEIHLIRPQTLIPLDNYKQNTVEFQRQRTYLVVPFRNVMWLKDHNLDPAFGVQDEFCRSEYTGSSVRTSEEKVALIRAWMYIGRPDYWDPLINGLDYKSVETFTGKNRRWLDKYYHTRRPVRP